MSQFVGIAYGTVSSWGYVFSLGFIKGVSLPWKWDTLWVAVQTTSENDRILLEDGRRFTQHSHNPRHASYVDSFGEQSARLRIHRVYPTVTKAKIYIGDKTWTPAPSFSMAAPSPVG